MFGPNPNDIYPNPKYKSIVFLKNIVKNPNIIVGDYTFYSSEKECPTQFETHVTHHYDWVGDKLIIGKFCAIGEGIEFIMNGANHRMCSITTYPFDILESGWELSKPDYPIMPFKGDTVIGNDVWIGQNVTILPGIKIGDGAILGAGSLVTKDVEPYTIIGGNPAKAIRKRFTDERIEYLLDVKWWNWDIEKVSKNLNLLCSCDINVVQKGDIKPK